MKNHWSPIAVLALAALALSACDTTLSPPVDPTEPGSGGGNPPEQSIGDLVKEMPELTVQLPASLSADTTDAASRSAARAVGDTVTVEATSLEPVRSQGWYQLQSQVGMDMTLKLFLDVVKATIPDDAVDGTVVTTGVLNAGDFDPEFGDMEIDFGSYRVSGDGTSVVIYWYFEMMSYEDPSTNDEYYCRITTSEGTEGYEAEFLVSGTMLGVPDAMNYYSYFNEATGESVSFDRFDEWSYVRVSYPNEDGSFTALVKGSNHTSVAWGDDLVGGILSKSSWEGDVSVWSEFYAGGGELISAAWGDSGLDSFWFPPASEAFNLATLGHTEAPQEFWYRYDSGAGEYQYRTSLAEPWEELSGYDPNTQWFFVWAVDPANPTSGDAEYFWNDWDPDNGSSLTIGFQIPEAVQYLGETIYQTTRYPLRRLLPLAPEYDGYAIRRLEGETYTWEWQDWDGVTQTDSWTDYTYYLDSLTDGTPNEIDEADVDLRNVHLSEMYYWDPAAGRYTKVKAPIVQVSGDVPSYFSFTDGDTVATIEARINSIYEDELVTLSVDAYADRLLPLHEDPVFDALR